jgi:Ni,Fe-hydrogenase I large subunit
VNLDGKLDFSLRWDGARVQGIAIESTRAVGASRVLEGKPPADMARLVPMLFSLCGRAQGIASLRAWEAAEAVDAPPATALAREWVVAAEAVLENLWRLLLDWPEAMGEDANAFPEFAAWRRSLLDLARRAAQSEGWLIPGTAVTVPAQELPQAGAGLLRFLESQVLGMDAPLWGAANLRTLEAWWNEGRTATARITRRLFEGDGLAGGSDVPLLDAGLREEPWRRVLDRTLHETGFPAKPDWQGEPRETGALARTRNHPAVAEALALHGNCIAVRVLARLADTVGLAQVLAGTSDGNRVHAVGMDGGTGAAWVETSRGVLAHVLVIRDARVARHRMLAPTEWNFHPRGPFVRGLQGQDARSPDEVGRKLRLQAMALDPCVGYEWKIGNA